MPVQKINIGAAPNDKTGDSLREAFALTNAAIDQVNANTEAIAGKVDKAAGMGLSQNSFTDAEQEKLAGLEGTHWRGTFTSLTALQTAIPAANAGDYADVDTGVGADVQRYIWDVSDTKWVQQGAAATITAAQVKALYESNPDTNAFPDASRSKLAGIDPGATANQTDAYLRDRANHTGTQSMETVNGLLGVVEDVGNLRSWREAIAKGIPQDLIINGNMEVSWRGTSWAGVTAANSAYFLDRWTFIQAASSAVGTIAQVADASFGANTQTMRYTVTTADASATAGHVVTFLQKIEGFRVAKLVSKPFVLRFKVRSPKTGKHCIALKNSGGDRSYVAEYTVNAANTVEEKVLLFPGLPTDGAWDFAGMGLAIGFTLKCGATYQTVAGAWQAGDYWGSAGAVNACDTVGNVFAITDVHLHEGDANTPYAKRTREQELDLCYRYLPVIDPETAPLYGSIVANGYAYATTDALIAVPFRVPALRVPTGIIASAMSNYFAVSPSGNPTSPASIFVHPNASKTVGALGISVASPTFTAGQATALFCKAKVLYHGCEL